MHQYTYHGMGGNLKPEHMSGDKVKVVVVPPSLRHRRLGLREVDADPRHPLQGAGAEAHRIKLGPEGGDAGGEIVARGTPEEVAGNPRSFTGNFLRRVLHLPALAS